MASFICSDDSDILVINGYAGTGKTTVISAVIRTLRAMRIQSVLLAPTGRSAKVLEKISGRPAQTVHKHIYRQSSVGADGFGQFKLSPNKAKNTLFVVDEVSLIGAEARDRQSVMTFGTGNLLEDLVSFVRAGNDCALILLGDSAQLPPVGLESSPALTPEYMDRFGGVRYSSLTTVVRQALESGILANATNLRNLFGSGEIKLDADSFPDVERITGGEFMEKVSEAYDRYGEDETIVLCRSNKRANRYNIGIRSYVQYKEERLVRDDKLMIVKNCYQFADGIEGLDYIANGDIAKLIKIRNFEERYGLHFADATLRFPDYGNQELTAKVCLDTLDSENASLDYEQQNNLYQGVSADYSHLGSKKKIWEAVREDKYFNALQLKYAYAITCHKSQGGQWDCVFIDCPFWQDVQDDEDLKWMYTALTRAVKKIYLVNFNDRFFR
ncbi:MAG: AAA family ATPase [Bacteroidales bacterium]|nr:AAA family ATPase [Candidatus Cryptobacteroides fimicaballi]